jgi:hypothetical protein
MVQWLLNQIQTDDPGRKPDFALTSAVHWMAALSHEVQEEHGTTFDLQTSALQSHFANIAPRRNVNNVAEIFEPLFASMNFATALVSAARRGGVEPWESPGLVITWYYANYNAVRSMLAARSAAPGETHAKAISSLNDSGLRGDLPHPFNMVAAHRRLTEYDDELPSYPQARRSGGTAALVGRFDGTRSTAREMLLEYLSGTAGYEVWRVEERIKRGTTYANFRTAAARAERDRQLKSEVNYLDCAFRYRGKSNYRDPIFMSYGGFFSRAGMPYVTNMAVVARFVALVAMEYVGERAPTEMAAFRSDLEDHYPGLSVFRENL